MKKFGCPIKFTALVRQLRATVLDNGDTSDSFPVTNGVKQGCVLAPTLFSMVFAAMLHDASQDNDDGIQLKYRTDGGVFNLRRLKANTNVNIATLRELLFADECALNSNTGVEMQQCVNHFSRACNNFGFIISTKTTEVMHQPAPRNMYQAPQIFVNDKPLKATDSFTYLRSTLSKEANIDVEVNNRLSKANSAFGRLRKKVWDRRGIGQDIKLKVYTAVVLTVLLYACESWTMYSCHARKLNHFHTKCLRIMLSIKCQEMVHDTEVITQADIPSIPTLLQKAQVRWAGHVTRMPDDRLPKQLLYCELCYGKRSVGGQKKRSEDTLKNTRTSFHIDVTNWEVCAHDQPLWHSMIHTGARTAETIRIAEAQKNALLAKRDFTLPPSPQPARHTHASNVEECCRPKLD